MASKPRSEWSAAYRRRVERAEARGLTRQQARGHKAREHVERKQREIEKYKSTQYQRRALRDWYNRFNPYGYGGVPTRDAVQQRMEEKGWDWFRDYKAAWNKRKAESERGTKERHMDYLEDLADDYDVPDETWFFTYGGG